MQIYVWGLVGYISYSQTTFAANASSLSSVGQYLVFGSSDLSVGRNEFFVFTVWSGSKLTWQFESIQTVKASLLGSSLFSVGDGVWWFKSVYSFGSVGKLKWNRGLHDEIRASSDKIFGVPPQMKLNPPPSPAERQISSRSDFIHQRWISSAGGGFRCKKHLLAQVLFAVMCVRFRCKTVTLQNRCTDHQARLSKQ